MIGVEVNLAGWGGEIGMVDENRINFCGYSSSLSFLYALQYPLFVCFLKKEVENGTIKLRTQRCSLE